MAQQSQQETLYCRNIFMKSISTRVVNKNAGFTPTPKKLFGMSLQSKRGFTLIEALVAISILLVSIAGPLTIAAKSLSSAVFARDQITAFYLTQEAIEFIKNKRDNNTLTSTYWLSGYGVSGVSPDCTASNGCTVDIKNNNISECPNGGCPSLRYNEITGFYSYEAEGSITSFTRSIFITPITPDEISVEVRISWNTGIFTRDFAVKGNIFNWQQ